MWIKMGFSLFFSDARAANFSPRAQLAAECFSTQRRRPNLFHLFELAGSLSRAGGSFTAALYQLIIHFGPIIVIVM